ncbi:MAG: hypothetical protein ACJ762_20035 [Solirubrobacteraceae bacterium]
MTGRRLNLRSEDGVAMIVAMGVLAVMLVLSATVVSSSSLLSSGTTKETARKRAFEAAEAGLQATVYRLNMLAPSADKCIGGSTVTVQAPTGAACTPYSESLGNGATYTAWTTASLSTGGSCAGTQVGASTSIAERCVTASGTVDGVTRRVQTRVASYASAPIFPLAGVVGLSQMTFSNNVQVVGGIGSNGGIYMSNSAAVSNTTIGPSAPTPTTSNSATTGVVTRRTAAQGPFALAPVDPGNSVTVNDNGRIANALRNPPVQPADTITVNGGGVSYDATTRMLSTSGNATLTLGGGIYNFCGLSTSNNTTIRLAPGARTAIYIDSPARPGSGCAAGSGSFSMANGTAFDNTSPAVPSTGFAHDPTALQLYVVGGAGSSVNLVNNTAFYGTVYAPNSTVNLSNSGIIYGAVAAGSINMTNFAKVVADPNATSISTSGGGVYFRSSWRECRNTPTTTDPSSGC